MLVKHNVHIKVVRRHSNSNLRCFTTLKFILKNKSSFAESAKRNSSPKVTKEIMRKDIYRRTYIAAISAVKIFLRIKRQGNIKKCAMVSSS